jgi:cytochrome oxidase Cu insertion factor (SCO1/SenC/PrrC family)
LAVALVVILGEASSGPATSQTGGTRFAGAQLPAGVRAPGFALADQSGRRVSMADAHGEVTVLAFLSTSCARACVLVAQQIRGALDELAHPPRVLIVSADATADTPARVARFLEQVGLSGRAHYLSGSAQALRSVLLAYGVQPLSAGRTAFERAMEVRLIDGRGRERVLFGLEQLTPEALAHDVRVLGRR